VQLQVVLLAAEAAEWKEDQLVAVAGEVRGGSPRLLGGGLGGGGSGALRPDGRPTGGGGGRPIGAET